MEEKAQASAEFILIIGGIVVIVLLGIKFYNDYLSGLANELNKTEVSEFNSKLKNISNYFKD